jgi:hypothetical protein
LESVIQLTWLAALLRQVGESMLGSRNDAHSF